MVAKVAVSLIALIMAELAFLPPSWSDRVVIAGRQLTGGPALISKDEEILAPLLPGLNWLGVICKTSKDSIDLTTPRGSKIRFTIGSRKVVINGQQQKLRVAPIRRGQAIYLPARALAQSLGASLRWQEDTRSLFLFPQISEIVVEKLDGRAQVKVIATAPLTCRAETLRNPDRAYFDFLNVDLLGPKRKLEVGHENLLAVRVAQFSLDPNKVRVVLDLSQPTHYGMRREDGGCTAVIELPVEPEKTAITAPPVKLEKIRFERISPRLAQVIIKTSGPAQPHDGMGEKGRKLEVKVENAFNCLPKQQSIKGDPLVAQISTSGSNEQAGLASIIVSLKSDTPYAVIGEENQIRIVMAKLSINDAKVVIDAGHGGRQPGAIGPSGLMEKEVNLEVVLKLRKLLANAKVETVLTRCEDKTVGLYERAQLANAVRADIFVSVHANASARRGSRSGTETYYRNPFSRRLAEVMQEEMVKVLKRKDGGVRNANFVVVRETVMPAVLVELAYLDNQEEEALLATPEFRQKAAEAIFNGIKSYVERGGLLARYDLERERKGKHNPAPPVVSTPPDPGDDQAGGE